jgi:hypothetical protein
MIKLMVEPSTLLPWAGRGFPLKPDRSGNILLKLVLTLSADRAGATNRSKNCPHSGISECASAGTDSEPKRRYAEKVSQLGNSGRNGE